MRNIFILSLIWSGTFAQLSPNTVGKDLDKNYVKARIHTDNDKCWNKYGNQYAAYEVPKGRGRHAMFANSVWIGGLDAGGQLHIAANTYKQTGTDFWPGPLDTANITVFSATNSAIYNKLWKVDCKDIDNFVTAFNSGSVSAGTYTIPDGIKTYPAQGTANFQKAMLPFADVNNNGVYNPQTDGDYPLIKGQQQVLSIFNDRNGLHTETHGAPMGVEIYERSYAYFEPNIDDTMQAINYTTFFHYTIYNRSNVNYNNVYITDWNDVDLGNWTDDFVGTDVSNNFAYCYNGNPIDPSAPNNAGYGNKPPVMSHAILKTICTNDGVDNNNNSQIDEPGEQFGLSRTTYFNNNNSAFPPATTNPNVAIEYYNYMTGFWKDGSAFTYSGNAYGGTIPTSFVYTGDPSTNTGWTETTAGNTPGDRRLLQSSGPFNFPAGSRIEWGYALVFSQDTSQVINTITQFNSRVVRDVRNVRYYDETHQAALCTPQVYVGIKQNDTKKISVMVYPNPAIDFISIDLSENVKTANVTLIDLLGRAIFNAQIKDGYRASLDLSTLNKGVYFVEVTSGDKKVVEKIVKN
ncbi:MAG: T9SS type A sorting domain-containing protein [Bacteroidota bacterium]